jgi:hypothetical protein
MTLQVAPVTDTPSESPVAEQSTADEAWSARVFAAAVAVALPLILWFGRDHWFFLDDWWALTKDGLTRPGYLDDHNGHWSTLLRFDFRLNLELWGMRSYLPYQVPVALAHLGAAALLRQVIRQLGARGWIATACAVAFLFFGTGRENMIFAFQFSQTGSVACGLALFLFTDGPRRVSRRDWLVLGIGVLGLMTSGMFLAFLAGFGVTTLLRRGARVAAFYTVPLGMVYGAWYLLYGREGAAPFEVTGRTVRFAGRMFWSMFDALGQGPVGAILLAVAVFGLGLAVLRARRDGTWSEAALPIGLAVGWMVFAMSTAAARANIELTADTYDSGRYLHVSAALLLPLVAAGAEELARRRTLLAVVALVPLAVGLPGNLDKLSHTERVFGGNPDLFFAMAHSPFLDDVPPDTKPLSQGSVFEVPVTAEWLARQVAAGHIPEPDGDDPAVDLGATTWLVLAQQSGSTTQATCPRLDGPLRITLEPGDSIRFTGAIGITATDGAHESVPRQVSDRGGSVIDVLAGPVDVVVRPALGQQARMCAPNGGTPESASA